MKIRKQQHSVFLISYTFKDVTDVFQYPCPSSKVGIMKLGRFSESEKRFSLETTLTKCVFFVNNDSSNFVITYLHDS